jgi:hypothetical protein
MPDLRNVRILRSRDVGVDHSEDKRSVADVVARNVVGRRKGTGFMRAFVSVKASTYLLDNIPFLESTIPGWTVMGGSDPG